MQLKRIKVKDYLLLKDTTEYNFAIKYGDEFREEEDTFKIGDIYKTPFGIVKDFQQEIEEKFITLELQMEYISKIKPDIDIGDMWLDDMCRGASYFTTCIAQLLENESELLSHMPSSEEIEAGLDRFKGLGTYLQIRQLAGKDVTKMEKVKLMPYEICFLELYTRKQENDFQEEINKIHNRKK